MLYLLPAFLLQSPIKKNIYSLIFWKLVSYSWQLYKFLLASGDTCYLLSSLSGAVKLL